MVQAPPNPALQLSLGITGHRQTHPGFHAAADRITAVLAGLFARIDGVVASEVEAFDGLARPRLNTLLADGTDQLAARLAAARGWELVAPLPFGSRLNLAINAHPAAPADAAALLAGGAAQDPAVQARAAAVAHWYDLARVFALADRDEQIAGLFAAMLAAPGDAAAAERFSAAASSQVALAGRVLIEQSDLLIAVWDGRSTNLAGGTGHTIAAALDRGCAVVRIDPAEPDDWHILHAPESLAAPPAREDREGALDALVRDALRPGDIGALRAGAAALAAERWHPRSSRMWTGYRRMEALFGGEGRPFRTLVSDYEPPELIAAGSGAAVLAGAAALPGGDTAMVGRIEREVMQRFAWADGISARLSDAYRGGMTISFILSALAITSGVSYELLGGIDRKWAFAMGELVLLGAIVVITWLGGRRRWHKRWFETRRVAEYLRHAPILLLLGVARPPGRWPKGTDTSWPEYYSRHALRALGLPRVELTPEYLRVALERLLGDHVVRQRDYHYAKARRLTSVHHRLDHLSERLFMAAVISVSTYLLLASASHYGLISAPALHKAAKVFSFLGVIFPTFGASLAGIRYFGDFERFAAISQITAEKLDGVDARIRLLLSAPDNRLSYAQGSELAHAADEIVVSEIENWQAVFGGKHITVPV